MAEVVGTVAAVLQLTQAAATTALQVYEFFSVIHNAPQEISMLSRDVRAFCTLFHNLETSLGSASVKAAIDRDVEIESALKTLIDPISNCRAALSRTKDKLRTSEQIFLRFRFLDKTRKLAIPFQLSDCG
ncbi:hypothetical protein E8E15_011421 [Penicillium rubens]|jgi:hypothetical protein|uniref:Fungal N-terminal domain-containing protein n=1 Tax=Penicillium chrysogenum TaxID=5076 RepID=A0A167R9P9_PENCH|nr:uncharacterized protein N7525_005602 [Penicillium rubens]KAF3030179.1 hypothetical protein E8E15_011421 [Penicillium rubens]KAJ5840414.1 hypothetical protein N7525_005602 [Penicillium rubens]KAJ5868393.1 hypothetical protein N7534_002946 [Penicillium rubens]KZN85726.1 hypothetical protein EN45_099200 [Penicillium chrysogenum]